MRREVTIGDLTPSESEKAQVRGKASLSLIANPLPPLSNQVLIETTLQNMCLGHLH